MGAQGVGEDEEDVQVVSVLQRLDVADVAFGQFTADIEDVRDWIVGEDDQITRIRHRESNVRPVLRTAGTVVFASLT